MSLLVPNLADTISDNIKDFTKAFEDATNGIYDEIQKRWKIRKYIYRLADITVYFHAGQLTFGKSITIEFSDKTKIKDYLMGVWELHNIQEKRMVPLRSINYTIHKLTNEYPYTQPG